MPNRLEDLKELLRLRRREGSLPYISEFWNAIEVKRPSADKTCYSNFYNGYIFPDLPVKPLSTPFEFKRSDLQE